MSFFGLLGFKKDSHHKPKGEAFAIVSWELEGISTFLKWPHASCCPSYLKVSSS